MIKGDEKMKNKNEEQNRQQDQQKGNQNQRNLNREPAYSPKDKIEKNPDWDETREGREMENDFSKRKSNSDEETVKEICPNCGMEKEEWSNDSEGYDHRGETFCCEGCAEGAGCTCNSTAEDNLNPGCHPGQGID